MRIARLDGVRGIAILIVVLHHHHFLDEIGWAGVDLFFVLSGFLITNILRRSRETPAYWARFYLKRAARILPPLAVLFLVALATSHRLGLLATLGYMFFLGNVMDVTRYAIVPFGALWSLAVEEHFYLLWPGAVRTVGRVGLMRAACLVILLEPLLRALATPYMQTFTPIYLLTPFRLDGLAYGALLALLLEEDVAGSWLQRVSGRAAWASASLYAGLRWIDPRFIREENTVFYNSLGYALVAAVCFFTVAWVVQLKQGWGYRLLSAAPLAYLGRISYGVYLYHTAVLTLLKRVFHVPFGLAGSVGTRKLLPVEFALTLALAAISYRWIEVPSMRWANRVTRRLGTWNMRQGEDQGVEQRAA